jgi:hypothetical protein
MMTDMRGCSLAAEAESTNISEQRMYDVSGLRCMASSIAELYALESRKMGSDLSVSASKGGTHEFLTRVRVTSVETLSASSLRRFACRQQGRGVKDKPFGAGATLLCRPCGGRGRLLNAQRGSSMRARAGGVGVGRGARGRGSGRGARVGRWEIQTTKRLQELREDMWLWQRQRQPPWASCLHDSGCEKGNGE